MTVRGSADVASLIIDGIDILGTVTEITDKVSALTEETHTLGDAWVENKFVGVRRFEITQSGFYDDAALSAHAALSTGPGNSSRVLTYQPAGTATGAPFKGMSAVQVDYSVEMSRGALHKAVASYLGGAAARSDEGKVLWTLKALGADSSTAGGSIDNTVSSSFGGAGYFQLTAFTSGALATAVLARVQHSSDNVTFADLISFTAATAAPVGQRIALGSTVVVERYTRMATSYTGGSSAQATMFVGFARANPFTS